MSKKLNELIKKRDNLGSQLKLFGDFLAKCENISKVDSANLEKRFKKIDKVLDQFMEVQVELELIQPSENESNIQILEDFQNLYFETTSKAEAVLAKFKQENCPNDEKPVVKNISNDSSKSGCISLPKINLPNFDGNFTKWREFSDMFKNIIHNNADLLGSQKLCYLKASLKGEPLKLLSALETTDINYTIAWERLRGRYENKRKIVTKHICAILDIPNIVKENHLYLRDLVNIVQNNLDCLKGLDLRVAEWDAILIPILTSKIDSQTAKEWETKIQSELSNDDIPSVAILIEFLNQKASTLESMQSRISKTPKTVTKSFVTETKGPEFCSYCKSSHKIENCESFLSLTENERSNKALELKLCLNCLKKGHFANVCRNQYKCKICKRKHNTLLHFQRENKNLGGIGQHQTSDLNPNADTFVTQTLSSHMSNSTVLLSTANVIAKHENVQVQVRTLLDSASQSNFISKRVKEQLNLPGTKGERVIKGINGGNLISYEQVTVTIKSNYNNYENKINCLVLENNVLNNLPTNEVNISKFTLPNNIKLADPSFNVPAPIELLIGANTFYDLLCIGQIKQKDCPILQKTVLGWVVSGELPENSSRESISCLTLNEVNANIERFWNLDEHIEQKNYISREDEYCENYFQKTTFRDNGRFVVRVPFKENFESVLGDSREIAKIRFERLEKRLASSPKLGQEYHKFMNEYLELGHMEKIIPPEKGFYLPHHGVINEGSETTKLRVVFDGSCKLKDGVPINSLQCTGPTIQNELVAIITKFRTYPYVITADIRKMYRQVLVNPLDRKYQLIYWRSNPNEELDTYMLNTVTYGTTAAPFLAVRALTQLAYDFEFEYPQESKIIRDCFYVDDLLTGADTIEDLAIIKSNLNKILASGKFELAKWTSNVQQGNTVESDGIEITDKICKKLGVWWNPKTDVFSYRVGNFKTCDSISKRTILSAVSQLFDPLGLLAPIIIYAKILMQELWKLDLSWDESVPLHIQSRWLAFKNKLEFVEKIEISRHAIINGSERIELHSFCDASQKGYGACIYLKSFKNNTIQISLLAAKSRVAPIKLLTIPRLELCAALLAAKLVTKVKSWLQLNIDQIVYWSDSTIVISWIRSNPQNYQTYVANRLTEILSLTEPSQWNHVKSKENPADLISRGMLPDALYKETLWWQGPTWISESASDFCDSDLIPAAELPEIRKNIFSLVIMESEDVFKIINFSSFTRLKQTVAYCLRFIANCKEKIRENRLKGPLAINELINAQNLLIKQVQREQFLNEIVKLKNKEPIDKKSKLLSLSIFLDTNDILRVGGRLKLSDFDFDKKHPILLPKKHHLTKLVFVHYHRKLLHANPKLLLSTIREQFWPINGRCLAKEVVRNCVRCFRYKANAVSQFMGDLPKNRIQSSFPFNVTGIDYAGPFIIKDKMGRGAKHTKVYIAVFVCFSTKAIHTELVSDLSTVAFLLALRRFVARRGKPSHIYSDNATNFIGAKNEINDLYDFLSKQSDDIIKMSASENIQWHFIPPYAPNFGGLWESGVKSIKYHLRRVLRDVPLTYEHFYTVLVQIESILNSRPLTPLSTDPTDMEALTPAHLLIGRTYTAVPDTDVSDVPTSRLTQYHFLQQLNNQFWQRWSKEYIAELQQRTKWKQMQRFIKVGDMVLIKEDNLPPSKWLLGRIINVITGQDDVPRVAIIKCHHGEIKRAISKLCVLPLNDSEKGN